jgi:tetratricopeptide (TPR) repeat protein
MPNWTKAVLAMGGAVAAFGIVMLVIFIIAFPPFFRSLEPRYQQRLINMFPPLDALRPTAPFQILPTLGGSSNEDAAQQLLLTPGPVDSGTPLPGAADLSQPGSQPDAATLPPTITPTSTGGIPVGMAGTEQPTMLPTYVAPTQAAAPTWTPMVAPTQIPLPAAYKLDLSRVHYELQGWNNCGPTTMTMALSYYGWSNNQEVAAKWMKPNPEDKNVSPWQMVKFVNDNTGVKALYRIGGNIVVLKRLLAADFPVVVEESIQPAGEGWMGHYLLLVGYDDTQQEFLTFDSYLGNNQGQGRPSPYSLFDDKWRQFNRVFMAVYQPSRDMDLRQVLGDYVDPAYGYSTALEQARSEASRDRTDKWAWFNMGTAYVALKDYANAALAYDQALKLGLPFRMQWYQFGPYEAYFFTGRYTDVLAYATASIANTPYVEEAYYWQGMVYAAQGDTKTAVDKFNQTLKYDKNFFPAQDAKTEVESGTFTVAKTGP